jgi:hypothetical protein
MVQIETRRIDSGLRRAILRIEGVGGLSESKELRQIDLGETSMSAFPGRALWTACGGLITSRRPLWLSA